jgi:hypothetical protein
MPAFSDCKYIRCMHSRKSSAPRNRADFGRRHAARPLSGSVAGRHSPHDLRRLRRAVLSSTSGAGLDDLLLVARLRPSGARAWRRFASPHPHGATARSWRPGVRPQAAARTINAIQPSSKETDHCCNEQQHCSRQNSLRKPRSTRSILARLPANPPRCHVKMPPPSSREPISRNPPCGPHVTDHRSGTPARRDRAGPWYCRHQTNRDSNTSRQPPAVGASRGRLFAILTPLHGIWPCTEL